mmetsp:Transcript_69949/g.134981  ORF Transcript_69949/g.134981 Transcript_69949/m.134981 type:complete len:81 (+) Transcript_69949:137-379(+)
MVDERHVYYKILPTPHLSESTGGHGEKWANRNGNHTSNTPPASWMAIACLDLLFRFTAQLNAQVPRYCHLLRRFRCAMKT